MSPSASALYRGTVVHRRFTPVEHAFRYTVFQLYLDLDELDTVFCGRWLWSTRRPAAAWFRRADHLGDPAVPLESAVRDLVASRGLPRPRGPIRLLTHLRYWGYVMNPVSFYYCFEPEGRHLEAVVAEVHNTPWGERHAYVLDARASRGGPVVAEHAKAFHVSPFMGMEMTYRWRLATPGEALSVHIENLDGERPLFDATLALARRPIDGRGLAAALTRHPWMTATVVAGIYGQALRLWWKRVPFHSHPSAAPDVRSPS